MGHTYGVADIHFQEKCPFIKPKWHWRQPPENNPLNPDAIDGIAAHHMEHPTADIWDVESWHLQNDSRSWKGFGYNWWVSKDGSLYEGRGFNQGSGILNHNHHVISVGFQGGYHPSEKFECDRAMPEAQLKAGLWLIIEYLKPKLPNLQVIDGHKYWNNTSCPGIYFPLNKFQWKKGFENMDNDILQLQKDLNILCHVGANGLKLVEDGLWGKNTEHSLKDFQRVNGLAVTGKYDEAAKNLLSKIIRNTEISGNKSWEDSAMDFLYEEGYLKSKHDRDEVVTMKILGQMLKNRSSL